MRRQQNQRWHRYRQQQQSALRSLRRWAHHQHLLAAWQVDPQPTMRLQALQLHRPPHRKLLSHAHRCCQLPLLLMVLQPVVLQPHTQAACNRENWRHRQRPTQQPVQSPLTASKTGAPAWALAAHC